MRKSTKEKSRITAEEVAYEILLDFKTNQGKYTRHNSLTSFKNYAAKLTEHQKSMVGQERSERFLIDDLKLIERPR